MFKQNECSVCDNVRKTYRTVPPPNELGGPAYLDKPDGMLGLHLVHSQGVGGVVKPFPFNEVKESGSLATMIKPAVEDLIDFPLIGVIQLDQWWWVYCSVGDLTRGSGFQQ